MAILALLILISLLVAFIFLIAFYWAVQDGQYEDEHTPAIRMLFDDDPAD
jgi:cbb3-type cytochrome oxidase maturation protein